MTKVINLLGGPGIGKTTTALSITVILKYKKYSVEYIPEVAKELVWKNDHRIKNQEYLFKKTVEILSSIYGKVDYIVTDGSFLIGLYYNKYFNKYDRYLENKIIQESKKYTNVNIFLQRSSNIVYENIGRLQNEKESIEIDNKLIELFNIFNIPYNIATIDYLDINLYNSYAYNIVKNFIL